MFHILQRSDQQKSGLAAVAFEGEQYGAGVSFFLGDLLPGQGPALHKHPYSEVCVVRSGQAAITVDGQVVVAYPGDIVIVGAETPHSFAAVGAERLDMVCMHAASRFTVEWLDTMLDERAAP